MTAARALLLIVLPLLLAQPGEAQSLDEAERLYRAGNMLEAARLARAAGTAEGHALAAKATLVDALYLAPETSRQERFEAAAADADQALELDPNHVGAMLRLAVVLGHQAELQDPVTAHMKGYAKQGRNMLERALAIAPEDAWANGLLGIWHLQVVRHGGASLAESLYGASLEEGRRLCARALDLDPEASPIRFGCARSLLDIDAETWREEALADLRKVVAAPVEDAASRLLRDAAAREIRNLRQTTAR